MLYFYCCFLFSVSTLCTYYCKHCFDSCCHNNAVNLCNTKTNIVCSNATPGYEGTPVYGWNLNSAETQLCENLSSLVSDNDCVFSKYSYDCFAHTSLEFELKRRHIKTVIVVGTVVNWCVDSTVRSAYHKDYNVVVLSDCVSGYEHAGTTGDKWVDIELDLFAEGFAEVMSSDAAFKALFQTCYNLFICILPLLIK